MAKKRGEVWFDFFLLRRVSPLGRSALICSRDVLRRCLPARGTLRCYTSSRFAFSRHRAQNISLTEYRLYTSTHISHAQSNINYSAETNLENISDQAKYPNKCVLTGGGSTAESSWRGDVCGGRRMLRTTLDTQPKTKVILRR